jgi:hypothetical protein
MNCFNHPDVPAVGICKACQKGLCMECAIDLGHGIACRNHREEVEVLSQYQSGMRSLFILMLLGVVLFLSGILMGTMDTGSVLRIMGTGMVVLSSLILALIWALKKINTSVKD